MSLQNEKIYWRNASLSTKEGRRNSLQSPQKLFGGNEKGKDTRASKNGKKESSSARYVADAFLSCQFLPKVNVDFKKLESLGNAKKIEKDFFQSLSRLGKYYNLELSDFSQFHYPCNISFALSEVMNKFEKKNRLNNTFLSLVKEKNKIFFLTEYVFDTRNTLFFVPILPISILLNDTDKTAMASLVLSICSYLNYVAQIPSYLEENSWLYYHYDALKDFHTDCLEEILQKQKEIEIDEDEIREHYDIIEQYQNAYSFGKVVFEQIVPEEIEVFEKKIDNFQAKSEQEQKCKELAIEFLAIYKDYPTATYNRYASELDDSENEDFYYGNGITMDKYVSFIPDNSGILTDVIEQQIQAEYNECDFIQEPTVKMRFDGSKHEPKNFDFESRFFELLNNFIYFLNKL